MAAYRRLLGIPQHIGASLPGAVLSYVVMLWLWGIIVNLLLVPGFYDIALRDFGLSLGALALARMSHEFRTNLYPG